MILRRFHLNPGTGGDGFHKGGDGVVRELLFRKAQVLSVLSERRAFRPYGMNGMVLFLFVCLFFVNLLTNCSKVRRIVRLTTKQIRDTLTVLVSAIIKTRRSLSFGRDPSAYCLLSKFRVRLTKCENDLHILE